MRKVQIPAIGIATRATNQKTHDQLANWTKMAPMIRPRTLPMAPQPPKTPIAPVVRGRCEHVVAGAATVPTYVTAR